MTITNALTVLESGGMIRLVAVYPEVEYLFQNCSTSRWRAASGQGE